MGNLISLTDPDNNTTAYSYNQLNEKGGQSDPEIELGRLAYAPTTTYQYDLNGNVTQTHDPVGNTTYYTYDNLNRLTGETWNNSSGVTTNTISYTYDKDGHLTGGSDDNSATTLHYNALGELTSDSVTYDGISTAVGLSLGYDADGNNTSLQATVNGTADLENIYTYDSLDRLTSITQQGQSGGNVVAGKAVSFGYTNIGQIKTVTRYAAASTSGAVVATTTNSYDHDNRLTGISTALGTSGSTTISYAFGYDADGRITSEDNSASGSGASLLTTDGAATLGYNNDNELTSVTPASGSSIDAESYSYDPAGNRTSAQTGVESGSSSVTPQGSNQVASDANYSYTYDFDGNLLTKTSNATGDVDTYTWDNRDRLVEDQTKTSGGTVIQTVTYTYSPITNQRLSQTVVNSSGTVAEYYVYDPSGNLLIVLDGSGNVKERDLTGPRLSQILATETGISGNSAGTVDWAVTNQVGSVTDVLNNSGAVIDHIRYDSFGNVEYQSDSANAMRFGYAGMQTDAATGLDYDNARYYDPQSGTFVSQDPLNFGGGGTNLYAYVLNDPASLTDSSGLQLDSKTLSTIQQMYASQYSDDLPDQNNAWDDVALQAQHPLQWAQSHYQNALDQLSAVNAQLAALNAEGPNRSAVCDLIKKGLEALQAAALAAAQKWQNQISAIDGAAINAQMTNASANVDCLEVMSGVAQMAPFATTAANLYDGNYGSAAAWGAVDAIPFVSWGKALRGAARFVRGSEIAAEEAKGGVYLLRDARTGKVMRTGRTGNLAVRARQHALNACTKDFDFEVVYRTDVYAEQRGLEQELDWVHNPPLNIDRPIYPKNKNLLKYLGAANDYLDRVQGINLP